MSKPITTARLQGKFKSNEELAKRLISNFKLLEQQEARSLATKIGDIDRGKLVWWIKRPDYAQALADTLGMPLVDLGLHGPVVEASYRFAAFPELPPLDLGREAPCEIGEAFSLNETDDCSDLDFWLNRVPLWSRSKGPMASVCWLHVPAGAGLSLFWAHFTRISPYEYLRVRRLSDAQGLLQKAAPVVIRLDEPGEDIDLLALAGKNPNNAVLVVAPFAAPVRSDATIYESYISWEFISGEAHGRRLMRLSNPTDPYDGIGRYEWRLRSDWQTRLLTWAEKRMTAATKDTLLTAAGVTTWIAQFSTTMDFIALPADLLSICRICHLVPDTRLPRFSDPHAGKRLLSMVRSITPGVGKSFAQLVTARLSERSMPWTGALPRAKWALLKGDSAAAPDEAALMAIANEGTAAARQRMAAALAAQMQASGLAALIGKGLLVEAGNGDFDLRPSFLVDLIARDHLIESIATGSIESWAMLCYDDQRRPLVDAAMSAMPTASLDAVVARLAALPASSPAAVAASDALFWNIGLRLPSLPTVPAGFQVLAGVVFSRMSAVDDWVPQLWSRKLLGEEERVTWESICWAWSLCGIRTPCEIPDSWAWFFPGWDPHISKRESFGQDDCLPAGEKALSRGWRRKMALVPILIETLARPDFPPDFLKPYLLVAGCEGRWPIESHWLDGVMSNKRAEDLLLAELHRIGRSAACILLPHLVDYRMKLANDASERWTFNFSRVRTWVLQTISDQEFNACLDDRQLLALLATPQALPHRLVHAALRAGRIDHSLISEAVAIAIDSYGPLDNEALVGLIESSHHGNHAAARLWVVAPAIAAGLALSGEGLTTVGIRCLVFAAPQDQIGTAARAIHNHRNVFEREERLNWLRIQLGDACSHAEGLFIVLDQD